MESLSAIGGIMDGNYIDVRTATRSFAAALRAEDKEGMTTWTERLKSALRIQENFIERHIVLEDTAEGKKIWLEKLCRYREDETTVLKLLRVPDDIVVLEYMTCRYEPTMDPGVKEREVNFWTSWFARRKSARTLCMPRSALRAIDDELKDRIRLELSAESLTKYQAYAIERNLDFEFR